MLVRYGGKYENESHSSALLERFTDVLSMIGEIEA
jgi:hypothetical protein